jgi:hypothetical protein
MEITKLIEYIEQNLSNQDVLAPMADMIENRLSSAGSRWEEVFTREFLCPVLAQYFYKNARDSLDLSNSEIQSGLGTEGYTNAQGFGFSPARKQRHLFTKSDIVKAVVPINWMNTEKRMNQACPDFAIRQPLPISIVGEVKFFRSGTPKSAVKELYDVARQAMFYLGAFAGEYDSALIVIADASSGHVFGEGLKLINPEILERFGQETRIYRAFIPLH